LVVATCATALADLTSPEIFASAFVALACERAMSGRAFTAPAPTGAISNDMGYLSYIFSEGL